MDGARLHRDRQCPRAVGDHRRPGRQHRPRLLDSAGRVDRRQHRRHAGPAAQGQADHPQFGRRPARRHRRLPDLRLRPGDAALGGRTPARRHALRGARGAATAGLELPVLPGRRQDRRPLLPRLPQLLERGGLLRRGHPDLSPVITAVLLVSCAALVFVPIKYIYPSRTTVFRKLNLTLAGLWVVLYAVILLRLPEPGPIAIGLSLSYIAYYLLASIYLTVRPRFRRA